MRTACIVVEEYGTRTNRSFTLLLQLLSDELKTEEDIKTAVRNACTDYVSTDTGKHTYEYNCHNFNWADFEMEIPDYFCVKHGFKIIPQPEATITMKVDWDEHLVNDDELEEENE